MVYGLLKERIFIGQRKLPGGVLIDSGRYIFVSNRLHCIYNRPTLVPKGSP